MEIEGIKIIFLSLLAVSLSLLMMLKPEWLWKIEHWWCTTKEGEPSQLYLDMHRMGGVLFFLCSSIMLAVVVVNLISG